MTALTGLVLAGGASTRMGTDKALLEVDGERLVDRVVRRMARCCDEVLVAPGPSRWLDVAGARAIDDAQGKGPLAGIVAGLREAPTPLLAVVAVDMPQADAAVLQALAGVWDGEPAVVPLVGGKRQPLHAVYAVSWTDRFEALLGAGERSVRCALHTLGARIAADDLWGAADPTGGFAMNLNSVEDLAAYAPGAEADASR